MATNFGTDVSCVNSLRTGRLVSGPRLVAEACFRRLNTPRGTLIGGEDEQNYGLDLADLIGSVATPSAEAALPGRIQAELLKDERVASVVVNVTSTMDSAGAVTWSIDVEGDTAEGPFSLQIGVSEVTVDLLGIQAG